MLASHKMNGDIVHVLGCLSLVDVGSIFPTSTSLKIPPTFNMGSERCISIVCYLVCPTGGRAGVSESNPDALGSP